MGNVVRRIFLFEVGYVVFGFIFFKIIWLMVYSFFLDKNYIIIYKRRRFVMDEWDVL